MNEIYKYDAARAALSAARSFEDVLGIKDKAAAYAKVAEIAKDSTTLLWAQEIKTRAERLAGQMLAGLEKSRGAAQTRSHAGTALPKLSEIGVSKNESSRWQALGGVPEQTFEVEIKAGHVTRSKIMRSVAPPAPKPKPAPKPAPKAEPEPESDHNFGVEVLEDAQRAMVENDYLLGIFNSDDKLAEAIKQIKELTELNRILTERNAGLMTEVSEINKIARSYKARCERMEKAK